MTEHPFLRPAIVELPYTWRSQERQFPKVGPPGIGYAREEAANGKPVDCFVYRNRKGHVIGILYHYPEDSYETGFGGAVPRGALLERAGNINVMVRPDRQRRGIATKLVRAAMVHGIPLRPEQQVYTPAGAELMRHVLEDTDDRT